MWNVNERFEKKAMDSLAALGFSVGSTRGVVRVEKYGSGAEFRQDPDGRFRMTVLPSIMLKGQFTRLWDAGYQKFLLTDDGLKVPALAAHLANLRKFNEELRTALGVPTFYTRLLQHPAFTRERCANIRLFVSGSAPLLAETHREFRTRTGHAILELIIGPHCARGQFKGLARSYVCQLVGNTNQQNPARGEKPRHDRPERRNVGNVVKNVTENHKIVCPFVMRKSLRVTAYGVKSEHLECPSRRRF